MIAALRGQIRRSREGDISLWNFVGPAPKIVPEYRVGVGEILHNLRSSLDHAVWELVLAGGNEPGRHTAFPISKDKSGFEKSAGRNLQGIAKGIREIIRLNQPWCAARSGHWLYSLHCLNNVDKHRHPNIAAVIPEGIFEHILPQGSTAGGVSGEFFSGPLWDGKEIMRFKGLTDDFDPGIRLQIVFTGDGSRRPETIVWWYAQAPVVEFLNQCFNDVCNVLRELGLDFSRLPTETGVGQLRNDG